MDMDRLEKEEDLHTVLLPQMETDWRGTKTVTECLGQLCLLERLSDVKFTFTKSPVKLPAHKFILTMRSAVFEAMFYGPLAKDDTEIKIDDIEPNTFKTCLRYMYTDEVALDGSNVLRCLYTARKYCLEGLAQKCSIFLQQSITVENVCSIHEQAILYDMQDLQQTCMIFMTRNGKEMFLMEDFLTISKETLTKLLADDKLASDEKSVFDAAIRWAKHRCTKHNVTESSGRIRHYLGDALYKIRFPLIPMETFASEISPSQLLTTEEEVLLYRYMATVKPEMSTTDGFVGNFLTRRRLGNIIEITLDQQNIKVALHPFIHQSNSMSITLTPMQSVKLHSIKSKNLNNIAKVEVRNQQGMFAANQKGQYIDKWHVSEDRLVFTNPIYLKKNVSITVILHLGQIVYAGSTSQIAKIYTIKENATVSIQQISGIFEAVQLSI